MNVIGADFSTRFVDFVKLPLEGHATPEWTRVELQPGGAFHATRTLRHALGQQALLGGWWDDVAVCYLERPYGRGESIHKLMRIQGALLACIPDRVVVDELAPGEWRKAVGLPGNATKEQVAKFAYDTLAVTVGHLNHAGAECWCCWPQDGFDAYSIALAGRAMCEKGVAA